MSKYAFRMRFKRFNKQLSNSWCNPV